MATTRTYGDACGVARALDLVGERWALLVVRELLLGPKRFTDLRTGMPQLSPNVLGQRLRELEQAGVVKRGKLPPPAASRIYELTDWGRELEPVVLALARWGGRSPSQPPIAGGSVDSLMLRLKALFDPEAAAGLTANYDLRLGEHRFRVRIANGRFELARGSADQPDAALQTDPGTLNALLRNDRQLDEALRAGDIEIEGSRPAVARFLGLFPSPPPAAPPPEPGGALHRQVAACSARPIAGEPHPGHDLASHDLSEMRVNETRANEVVRHDDRQAPAT
jgi:DNA-binding HxlR family transcriptional regulator